MCIEESDLYCIHLDSSILYPALQPTFVYWLVIEVILYDDTL